MNKKVISGLIVVAWLAYLAFLVKIILLKTESLSDIFLGRSSGYRSYNLVPFRIFVDYGTYLRSSNWLRAFSNIAGNLAVFVPFGLLLPSLSPRFQQRFSMPVMLALGLSILFESLQYVLALGSADIDDVLLNVAGAAVGVAAFRRVSRWTGSNQLQTRILILAMLAVGSVPAMWIATEEFGQMLGLTKYETIYEGFEPIPKREADAEGTLVQLTDKQLVYYQGLLTGNEATDQWLEKRQVRLNERTQVYRRTIVSGKSSSTIRYERLASKQYDSLPDHAMLTLWFEQQSNVPDVIVISDPLVPSKGTQTISTAMEGHTDHSQAPSTEEELRRSDRKVPPEAPTEEISGSIMEVDGDNITLNLSVTQETEGGAAVAVTGLGENAIKVNVKVTEGTKYTLRIANKSGTTYKDHAANLDMLASDQTVQITGKREGSIFRVESILIYRFE
ncbi:VanZ family protein [Paenibacillus sp. PR3]|uniref:VanZ family protein n=1 Tax=Paenibacillus terricola TaxID=2763503 RepID=A0ABR8MN12_9BACL|nr:VanZ family protein [Paenibacillus terricola]MBD3917408.1 VanZ family protein [Paenibacillus terricola]